MKLDKIKFAKVVSWISRMTNGLEFSEEDLRELDDIVQFDTPPVPAMNATDLHVLMALMQEGTRKIEAIKQHRMMTGYGLKESKDAVEKYWPDSTPKLSRKEMFEKLRSLNLSNDSEFHNIEKFIEGCFD